MPKAATEKSTKAATKTASAKVTKSDKGKRAPSAYNTFMKARLADYKSKHPDLNHKEAFTAVAGLWKDAPENPNRGKEAGSKKKTAEGKENVASKAKSRASRKKKTSEQTSDDEENTSAADE